MIERRFARLRNVIALWERRESQWEAEFRALFEQGDGPAIRRLLEQARTLRRRRRALELFVERWSARCEGESGEWNFGDRRHGPGN
ncbi:MAG: hypothetical protein QJR06_02510 [Alicyclobacillaceae bacterium]|nr:hypothetical protein [Alicyclobacillaceae bacterium]